MEPKQPREDETKPRQPSKMSEMLPIVVDSDGPGEKDHRRQLPEANR